MRAKAGFGSGLLGVLIFSGSLPATRLAVSGFAPLFLTAARAVIAALLGGALLWLLRQTRPARGDLAALALVSLGVVVGFPLLTALALRGMTSAQAIVFVGMLPLATALFGGAARRRAPPPGSGCSRCSAAPPWRASPCRRAGRRAWARTLMLAAILLCGLGYAEGAALSRRLGGWQVISWALLLALPAMAILACATWPARWDGIGAPAWSALATSRSSACGGVRVLVPGPRPRGIASVGQLQLLQPFLGLAWPR